MSKYTIVVRSLATGKVFFGPTEGRFTVEAESVHEAKEIAILQHINNGGGCECIAELVSIT